MKAIVQNTYGSPDVLQLAELAPPAIGETDVLVRVRAAGVDAGVWHVMTGTPYLVRLGFGLRRPRVAVRGLDLAGVVEAVGAKVTRFKVGDEVFGAGTATFAELACAPEKTLALKPKSLSFEQAATVPVSATTALEAMRAAKVKAGDRVLVVGASGGVGSFAVQLARALGAEVTGVCSAAKAELVRSLGATRVIDYAREDFVQLGGTYDAIIDIGGSRPLSDLKRVLAPRGVAVLVGGEGGGNWFGVMTRLLWGMVLSLFSAQKFKSLLSLVNAAALAELSVLLESGQVTPHVGQVFSLQETARAVQQLLDGQARGKIAIRVS